MTLDFALAARLACPEATACAYQRVGLAILRDVPTEDHWRMESAFRISCEELLGSPVLPVHYGGFGDAAAFHAWMKEVRPDVVLCNNPTPAWWIRPALTPAFACINCGQDAHISGFNCVLPLLLERALLHLESLLRRNQCGRSANPTILHVQPPWQDGTTLPNRANA